MAAAMTVQGPRTAAAMLREFHAAYGLAARRTLTPDPPEAGLRAALLAEEAEEAAWAVQHGAVVALADALADVVYVAYGTALTYGIDLDVVLREVHRSNMSKLGADGRPILRDDGKVVKGPNYSPPDIAAVIGAERADGAQPGGGTCSEEDGVSEDFPLPEFTPADRQRITLLAENGQASEAAVVPVSFMDAACEMVAADRVYEEHRQGGVTYRCPECWSTLKRVKQAQVALAEAVASLVDKGALLPSRKTEETP